MELELNFLLLLKKHLMVNLNLIFEHKVNAPLISIRGNIDIKKIYIYFIKTPFMFNISIISYFRFN